MAITMVTDDDMASHHVIGRRASDWSGRTMLPFTCDVEGPNKCDVFLILNSVSLICLKVNVEL